MKLTVIKKHKTAVIYRVIENTLRNISTSAHELNSSQYGRVVVTQMDAS
jgi:hypothetical protein